MLNPQLNRQGRLVHLLSTEGLSRALITALLDAADQRVGADGRLTAASDASLAQWQVAVWCEAGVEGLGEGARLVDGPAGDALPGLLRGDSVSRLARAATFLGATLAHWPSDGGVFAQPIMPIDAHSAAGTAAPIASGPFQPASAWPAPITGVSITGASITSNPLVPDVLVMRHRASGAAHWAARRTPGPRHIVNAGDGTHEDPVSGLTLVAALRRALPDLTALTVTLVGNLNASAAGRSCLHILTTLGVPEVRLATPPTLAPEVSAALGVQSYVDVDAALVGADVVVVLPMASAHGNPSRRLATCEYRAQYAMSRARLSVACPGAVVLLADGLEQGVEVADDLVPLALNDWGEAVSLAVLQTLIEGEA